MIGAALVSVAIAAFAVPDWYRVGFHCRVGHPAGPTPDKAVRSYYKGCLCKPHIRSIDADKRTSGYFDWAGLAEYEITWPHDIRWVQVGKRTTGDRWRVLDGEGSGP